MITSWRSGGKAYLWGGEDGVSMGYVSSGEVGGGSVTGIIGGDGDLPGPEGEEESKPGEEEDSSVLVDRVEERD